MPTANPQGEPVAWRYHDEVGVSSWFDGAPDQRSLDFVASRDGRIEQSYPYQAEHPAPVAVDVAKAFAKGFNTLEQANGKYRISMQFTSHDDAWTAYGALGKLNAVLAKQL